MQNTKLFIEQYELGPMQNLVYILADLEQGCATLVDPAWDVPFLLKKIKDLNCELTQIFLTHGHHDHVNGIPELLKHNGAIPIYLSKHEAPYLTPDVPNIVPTYHEDWLTVGNFKVQCLHTPGHTPGGQCFYFGDTLLTGDTLFVNGCGRCDLPGGDANILYHSLNFLKTLPDELTIYPGHSYSKRKSAILGDQKTRNPYLAQLDIDTFFKRRS